MTEESKEGGGGEMEEGENEGRGVMKSSEPGQSLRKGNRARSNGVLAVDLKNTSAVL